LNGIFKMAIAHGIIEGNPLAIVIVDKHERKHGTALSKEEEKKLLESMKATKYEKQFAVALYTGLRPNEFKTAGINGDFIVAVNSKRKNGRVEYGCGDHIRPTGDVIRALGGRVQKYSPRPYAPEPRRHKLRFITFSFAKRQLRSVMSPLPTKSCKQSFVGVPLFLARMAVEPYDNVS